MCLSTVYKVKIVDFVDEHMVVIEKTAKDEVTP